MAEIVGTITNLSDFLSKTQVCLSVKPNDPQQQIICLEADRKYSIPAFQREVRWDDNNLKMLLYDLSRSSKFLGNIILTIKSDHTCEIIDGQQRTTVLMLIVSCIKKKFGTKISTPDLCPLRNEGFTGFQTLLEKAFDQEAITSDDWNAILKSDDYLQLPRIQKLWNTISSSELLADRHKAQGLLDNLCKSEFNIIASYSNDVNTSIQYFLDVNLKGIRLDTEDIFKGYLFSQDSRELTRSLWQKNKRDVLRLNGVTQSSEEKRYPLMKLYEHFFYCDLYLPREGDCEYSTLKFGENFCLTSGFESGSTKYYEGSHLIEAIRDRDYLQNVLSRLNKCVEIMTDIIESEGPSTPFKDKFICAKKVDSIDIQNCHSMLKKIDTPEIKSIISGVLSRANIELADDISEKVIYEIASYASHTSQITPILNLSDFDRFELTAKINSLLAYDTNRVKEATDDIKASLKCVKRIRKKMERSSIENYDGYLQMKSDLNEQKSKCTQQLLEVDKELQPRC